MVFSMVHTNLNVSDLQKSLAFYKEALGLKEVKRKEAEDKSFVLVFLTDDAGVYQLELTWLVGHPQKYDLGENEMHIAFRTDDFDAAYARHKEMGCICFENPGMGVYFISDSDGYWIEILPEKKQKIPK